MIKRLKRRLILIFTFFTSLVLVLVLAFSMWNALEQNTKTHLAAFEAENELILSGIAGGNANTDWLDAMEQEKGIVLRVEKTGQTITL